MKLYMAVMPDKYELPLFVTPYLDEMAHVFRKKKSVISSSICHERQGSKKGGVKFIVVEVEDDNDE